MDDVVVGKVQSIEDCLTRIREVDPGDIAALERNLLVQESLLLNLQRACQASIDLAMHIVRRQRLGVPDDSRDSFARLSAAGLLDADLSRRLQAMVGFRNIAVHRYQDLDLAVMRAILDDRLVDLHDFADAMRRVEVARDADDADLE